ncbi:MAG: PilN domain-containing protein [Patescibacteria group bacterium]
MPQSIDLIPQQDTEIVRQSKLIRTSTVLTIFFLVVTSVVAGYYFVRIATLRSSVNSNNRRISEARSRIESLSAIEIEARNLDARVRVLREIYSSRNEYSVMLNEFLRRVPESVEVSSLNVSVNNTLSIDGTATDYLAISSFVNSLLEEKFEEDNVNGIFTEAVLNSVTLNPQTNEADFFMVVTFDPTKLKEIQQ